MTNQLSPADRQEAEAIVADIERRPSYHLCRAWLDRVALPAARSRSKTPNTAVEVVVFALRMHWGRDTRGRPTIAAALADPDLAESMALALMDAGLMVRMRSASGIGPRPATNLRESALSRIAMDYLRANRA